MKINTIRTDIVTSGKFTLEEFLDNSVNELNENEVVVISAKVISLCEGRTVPIEGTNLDEIIKSEAEWYMPDADYQDGYSFTIANNMLTPNSGIDESNADGSYVLWPKNPQADVNHIRSYLRKKFGIHNLAVIITDSDVLPLRWGHIGLSLAYSGIKPVRSYKDKTDLFGRPLKLTNANVVDCIASSATFVMGEGAEQTPIAIIQDIPNIEFVDDDPSEAEISARHASIDEDFFGPMLKGVKWDQGGANKSGDYS